MPLLTEAALTKLATGAFERAGVRRDMARDAAEILVLAEMMGIGTHGVSRVGAYVERIRAGGVDPDAEPMIAAPAPALRHVDGQNGLGPAVAARAVRSAMAAAREVGVGAAFCHRSTHLGALAPLLLIAAEAGYAAVCMTNTAPMIAPAGGRTPVIGNSPLGFAIPDAGGGHVILDMALSVAARSKVRRAAARGEAIPETWATDASGLPTTDAAAAMQGLMQAIGGAKGANLALCIDLLAAGIAGASILSEVPNANVRANAVANVGHLFIVIDAAKIAPPVALAERLEDARRMVGGGGAMDPDAPPRLPGARALAALGKAREIGVQLSDEVHETLKALAAA